MSFPDPRAAHGAFRRGRLREATVMAWVAMLLALGGFLGSGLWERSLPYGVLLVVSSIVVGYRGWGLGRMGISALLLGVIPLGCALFAQSVGHACTPAGCVSLCVPLCTSGGVLAGGLLARLCLRQRKPLLAFSGGAAMVCAAGAMGCSCVGWGGLLGMVLGVAFSGALVGASARLRRA